MFGSSSNRFGVNVDSGIRSEVVKIVRSGGEEIVGVCLEGVRAHKEGGRNPFRGDRNPLGRCKIRSEGVKSVRKG